MEYKIFKGKKKVVWLIFLSILLLTSAFFVSAYVIGKNVAEDVNLQWVSHTEYWKNDSASTIIRLADYRGNPYDVDSCSVTILYPDKTVFVDNGALINSNIEGNWYRADSLIGAPLGTYEQEVTCVKGQQTIISSQSFHLNPALEEIQFVSQNLNNMRNELSNVNLSLHARVQETGEIINFNLNSTSVTLSDLMNSVRNEITTNIDSVNANLSTQLTEVETSISGSISNTEANVLLELSNVNGSIFDLINNQLQPELELKIEQQVAEIMAQVSAVNISLTGVVESTGENINININSAETTISDLINNAEINLISEIQSTEATLDTSLTNVQVSLTNSLTNTENSLSTQLTNVNGSISNLLENIIQPELETLMAQHYNGIMDAVANVYTDTQWIVANTMDQEDRVAIDARFNSLDADLDKVLAFCKEPVTNLSGLCEEIYNIKAAIEILRQEQQAHFDRLDETTYSTLQLLSGDITVKINNILLALNIIQEQNAEINDTTHQILNEIQGEVQANIIS